MADLRINASLTYAVGITFIPVCAVMVGLRVYVRKMQKVKLGIDDWTVIGAMLFTVAMGVTMVAHVGLGYLGHPADVSSAVEGEPNANVAFWPVELLQVPSLGLVKLSFVFFYRRIFTKYAAERFNIISWAVIGLIIAWTIAFFFALLFICGTYFAAYWASTIIEKANCVDTSMLHNAFAISDVITDFIIILLPFPELWKLHLTAARKVGVTFIFLLGALTLAASIMRMVIFVQATSVNYDHEIDFNYLCTNGLYWSMIESGLGVCAACLPVLYGLFQSKGVQSMIRSAHSAISLSSLRSRKNSPPATIKEIESDVAIEPRPKNDIENALGVENGSVVTKIFATSRSSLDKDTR